MQMLPPGQLNNQITAPVTITPPPSAQSLSIPVELYALLPSIFGLLVLFLHGVSSIDIPAKAALLVSAILVGTLLSVPFYALLVVSAVFVTHFFFYPSHYLPYMAGLAFGFALALEYEPHRRAVNTILIFFAALGVSPLFPPGTVYSLISLGVASGTVLIVVGLFFLRKLRLSPVATSPATFLSTPTPNRLRFELHAVYFLVVGAPLWSQTVDLVGPQLAACIHIALTLILPSFLMRLAHIPFRDHVHIANLSAEIETLNQQKDVILQISHQAQTKAIAAVERSENELQRLEKELEDLRYQKESVAQNIESEQSSAKESIDKLWLQYKVRFKERWEKESARIADAKQQAEEDLKNAHREHLALVEKDKKQALKEMADAESKVSQLEWKQRSLIESQASTLTKNAESVLASFYQKFYALPWDMLVTHLKDLKSVSIPNHPTFETDKHFFIGRDPLSQQGLPLMLHEDILHEHIHILGSTGSNKTTLGIMPLVTQILRLTEKRPVIIMDLKGDTALFHTVREEAYRNNQEFVFFTLDSDKPTYRFNPFVGLNRVNASPNERSQPILDALGLNHGEGYGRSYFSRNHRRILLDVLREAEKKGKAITSLKDLYATIKSKKKSVPDQQKDELISALEGLFDYPQLFTTPEEEESHAESIIQFDRVLDRCQVVYFWLPAPTQSITVREVGKLALYSLFFAAIRRRDANLPHRQAHLIIDEFQQLVGDQLGLFLSQSRSYGISLLLSNQNISQLNSNDVKLWPLVTSNVRASMHFGSGDVTELELLSKVSGEARDELYSHGKSVSTGESLAVTIGRTSGTSISKTDGSSSSRSGSSSRGSSFSEVLSESTGTTKGDSWGATHGSQDSDTWGSSSGYSGSLGQSSSELAQTITSSSGSSSSSGTSHSSGKSSSDSWGTSQAESRTRGIAKGFSSSNTETDGWGSGTSESTSHGTTESTSRAETRTKSNEVAQSETFSQRVRPKLRLEDIQKVFNRQGGFILWIRRGAGLSDYEGLPVPAQGVFTMSFQEYCRRRDKPWPIAHGLITTAAQHAKKSALTEDKLLKILNDALTED